jgi:hypothetical protein
MRMNIIKIFALGVLSGPVLSACGTLNSDEFDRNFGQSVVNARLAQTQNPQASVRNQDAAFPGIDARVARETLQTHNRSYSAPEPRGNIFSIGVGTQGNN